MPLSLKTMKTIDLFCTSPASTAIVSSTELADTPRISRSSRPLHRLNSLFSDRENRYAPCTFELPFTPRAAFFGRERGRKSSVETTKYELPFTPRAAHSIGQMSRKSSAEHTDSKSRRSAVMGSMITMRRKSSADVYDLYSPRPSSSRYLLGDTPNASDSLALVPSKPPVRPGDRLVIRQDDCLRPSSMLNSQHSKPSPLVPSHSGTPRLSSLDNDRSKASADSAALVSSASSPSHNQVVVLRVSLHCKGCVGKLRKHLSKMEGVTSFSIDLATKKVTIVGNVTPLEVLTSISKVKNAQFWPSPSSSMSSSSSIASSASSTSTMDFSY